MSACHQQSEINRINIMSRIASARLDSLIGIYMLQNIIHIRNTNKFLMEIANQSYHTPHNIILSMLRSLVIQSCEKNRKT